MIKKNRANRHKHLLYISILFLSIFFSACSKNEVFYEFSTVKNEKWSKNDTLFFQIDSGLIQPEVKYNISIELANSANYPYQNIWLYVSDNIRDTLFENRGKQYLLADDFGKWHGSGWGAVYQISLEYEKDIIFPQDRAYCIKIVHGMRDEPLEGIEKVGIKIEKSE